MATCEQGLSVAAAIAGGQRAHLDGVLEERLGGLGGDGRVDNDLAAREPVGGGGDLVGVTELETVDDAEDLVAEEGTPGRLARASSVARRRPKTYN